MVNSVDPDQLASCEAKMSTDLDLHCLLRQGMSCSAREGLSICFADNSHVHVDLFTLKNKTKCHLLQL